MFDCIFRLPWVTRFIESKCDGRINSSNWEGSIAGICIEEVSTEEDFIKGNTVFSPEEIKAIRRILFFMRLRFNKFRKNNNVHTSVISL